MRADRPEVSTPQSAESPRTGLEDLVRRLHTAGFQAGISETIDAGRLLDELARRRSDIKDVERLETLLGPVFCKSADQQARFHDVFGDWVTGRHAGTAAGVPGPGGREPAGPAPEKPPQKHRRWVLIAAPLVVFVAFLGVEVSYRLFPRRQEPSGPTQTGRTSGPSGHVGRGPSPVVPSSGPAPKVYGYFPAYRWNEQVRLVWLWVILGAPLLVLFLFDLPQRVLTGGRRRRTGQPPRLRGWSREVAKRRLVLPLDADVAGRLRRHTAGPASEVRRLERRPQLHVRRTIDATIRNLGVPTTRFRDARLVPSYLILVEAKSDDDIAVHWASRFATEGLPIDVRRLVVGDDGVPRLLGLSGGAEESGLPLERLGAPPFGQRLIVVSDGAWMADNNGTRTRSSLRARFERWPNRVFFTFLEPRRWALREAAIERPEHTGDPGFLLLPVDENAVDAWSKLLVTGRLPGIQLESPQQYPRMIHDAGDGSLLNDEPPVDLAKLLAQLKLYLGPNGYFWLCCCAVPPIVHPQLVLLLGESFLRRSGAVERDLGHFVARNYRLLHRLPWIQHRRMPLWLRVSLLASIPREVQDEIRVAVETKLAEQSLDATGNLPIDFEEPPTAGGPVTRKRGDSGDTLYLGFLSGLSPGDLALRMPMQWARWVAAAQPRAGRWEGWQRRVRAVWDRIRFRAGLPFLGPGGWGVRAAIAGAAVAAIALFVFWRFPAGRFPQSVRDVLFVVRPNRLVFTHDSGVNVATFSPDGTRIVTASDDHTARIWDVSNGAPIGSPLEHADTVQTATFSPDGTRIVTASLDDTARIWDASSGAPIGTVLQHEDPVLSAEFSPDGTRVVTASGDHTARIWDARSGEPVGRPLEHGGPVTSATFSPDGAQIVTASGDRTARIWDARTGEPVGRPLKHGARVLSATFSPDGTGILTACGDDTARIWDAHTSAPIASVTYTARIRSASFSPDGERVVTAADDRTVRIWDAKTGALVGPPLQHPGFVRTAIFSPDGARILTTSEDRTARIWDAETGGLIDPPLQHADALRSAMFSPDGTRIVTASEDHTARVWDAYPSAPVGPPLQHKGTVWRADFSPDGTRVVTASDDRTARIWDARTSAPIDPPLEHRDAVISAEFSPDGSRIVTASHDHTARIWDARTRAPIGPALQHSAEVLDASFSPDGTHVVTASSDRTARIWDARTGAPSNPPLRHRDTVWSATFSPDGTRIVTASSDHTARVWDARTGAPIGRRLKHRGGVMRAMFSPDGARIATASDDDTARIWDANTGAPIGAPIRQSHYVWNAMFSPDGTRILTAATDHVTIWDARTGILLGVPFRSRSGGGICDVAMSPDSGRIVVVDGDAGHVLRVPPFADPEPAAYPLWLLLVCCGGLPICFAVGGRSSARSLKRRMAALSARHTAHA